MPSIQSGAESAVSDLWDDSGGPLHAIAVAFEVGDEVSANHFVYDDAILTAIEDVEHIESERFLGSQWETTLRLREIV